MDEMKSYCVKDHLTGHVFKLLLTEEELKNFLNKNREYSQWTDSQECGEAGSLFGIE